MSLQIYDKKRGALSEVGDDRCISKEVLLADTVEQYYRTISQIQELEIRKHALADSAQVTLKSMVEVLSNEELTLDGKTAAKIASEHLKSGFNSEIVQKFMRLLREKVFQCSTYKTDFSRIKFIMMSTVRSCEHDFFSSHFAVEGEIEDRLRFQIELPIAENTFLTRECLDDRIAGRYLVKIIYDELSPDNSRCRSSRICIADLHLDDFSIDLNRFINDPSQFKDDIKNYVRYGFDR